MGCGSCKPRVMEDPQKTESDYELSETSSVPSFSGDSVHLRLEPLPGLKQKRSHCFPKTQTGYPNEGRNSFSGYPNEGRDSNPVVSTTITGRRWNAAAAFVDDVFNSIAPPISGANNQYSSSRPLLDFAMKGLASFPESATFLLILISVFSMFSIVTFLCASHKYLKSRRDNEDITIPSSNRKLVSHLSNNISSKALLMVKLISWRKDEDDDDDDEALWKKTIMMGERCRPLDFSGRIIYDSEGNRLPESPPTNHSPSPVVG
ncbi:hypothetical protein HHK36_024575 [Tetracentron sinense]|uniref:Uncharacterized protein n=1 Tax=Tetracentron sinense TaxID=13715 RepID=A0A834YJL7_TETSI|nr:hypothetical protein HHK36_032276 [Tetracentron sinense]KAF8390054.1 hypothetical protein HHK36_024575 [Tetracentron sinense]